MEYRKLGKSEVSVTSITFGAWAIGGWMWGGADDKDAVDAMETAIDHGVTSIDTAPVYGFGHSEKLVGKAIKGKRDKVQILTKYGMRWTGNKGQFYFKSKNNEGQPVDIYRYSGKESIIKECEESLKRLGTDYIDLYQAHWPDKTTPVEETMEAIEKLLSQGKIKAAGVCNYSVELLDRANNALIQAVDQVPYSMVQRNIENDLVPYCIQNNIGILAYSPLQRGLLTGKITEDYKFGPGDSRPATAHFRKANIKNVNQFLKEIKPIADGHDATLAQLALNWTIHQPGISAALAGARNAQQVKDNVGAIQFTLTEEEMNIINQKIEALELDLS